MSKKVCAGKPLVVPTESEETLINRLKYEGKFLKASIWLHNLIIHRIEDIDAVSAHYTAGDFVFREGESSISTLFGQKDGVFCRRFAYYCEMIKKYEQGNIPDSRLADDFRLTNIMLSRLSKLAEDKTSVRHADRLVTSFHQLISGVAARLDDSADYHKKIDDFQEKICAAFARVSDDFYAQEHAHAKPPRATPATKDDVAEIVAPLKVKQDAALVSIAETRKIVKRMDNREKNALHRKKLQYTRDRLNAIHAQWLVAKQDPNVISISSHKADYDAALKYYKKEFNALGVYTRVDLKKALKAWSWHTSNFRTAPGTLPSNSQSVKSV